MDVEAHDIAGYQQEALASTPPLLNRKDLCISSHGVTFERAAFTHEPSNRIPFILKDMAYFLGLDAGATRTRCVLADDTAILARATSGTITILRRPVEDAEKNLDALLRDVAAESGVALGSIACTCVGLAGISVPRVADWVRKELHARVSGEILLAGDHAIALDAAFSGGAGVIVTAGTGSSMVGRASDGRVVHVGGWGPVVADEGSGSWIGRRAVRAVFDALDRDEETLLMKKVQEAWELPSIEALVDVANRVPGPDFPSLTPVVVECAQRGDPDAIRILNEAGQYLGMYAVLAAKRVQKLESQGAALPEVAFT
ncbi:MAG TPA: BadF/BadG/BcrA/BcrD ATPase family protein, partial [Acidobacteriaceae bacterium]|nr:BadF/BadG/BcrA/BcrD ATPase family protein [Acidobacteriaceae bacterium]